MKPKPVRRGSGPAARQGILSTGRGARVFLCSRTIYRNKRSNYLRHTVIQKKRSLTSSEPEGTKEKPPLTGMIKSGSTVKVTPESVTRASLQSFPKLGIDANSSLSTLLTRQPQADYADKGIKCTLPSWESVSCTHFEIHY